MAIDNNFYLGPYVKCKRKLVEKTSKIYGCSQCIIETSRDKNNVFCPKCGEKFQNYDYTETDSSTDLHGFYETLGENLQPVWSPYQNHEESINGVYGDGYDYFVIEEMEIPSLKGQLPDLHDDSGSDDPAEAVVDIDFKKARQDWKALAPELKKPLAILKKAYGKYELRWGQLVWYT